jgi:hypothetical protein
MLIVQTLAEEKEARPHSWDTYWTLENATCQLYYVYTIGTVVRFVRRDNYKHN